MKIWSCWPMSLRIWLRKLLACWPMSVRILLQKLLACWPIYLQVSDYQSCEPADLCLTESDYKSWQTYVCKDLITKAVSLLTYFCKDLCRSLGHLPGPMVEVVLHGGDVVVQRQVCLKPVGGAQQPPLQTCTENIRISTTLKRDMVAH